MTSEYIVILIMWNYMHGLGVFQPIIKGDLKQLLIMAYMKLLQISYSYRLKALLFEVVVRGRE